MITCNPCTNKHCVRPRLRGGRRETEKVIAREGLYLKLYSRSALQIYGTRNEKRHLCYCSNDNGDPVKIDFASILGSRRNTRWGWAARGDKAFYSSAARFFRRHQRETRKLSLPCAPPPRIHCSHPRCANPHLRGAVSHVKRQRSDQREARRDLSRDGVRDVREGQHGRDSGAIPGIRPDSSSRGPQRPGMPPDQRGAMPGREGGREDMRRADVEHGRERGAREHARFRDDAPPALPAGAPGPGQLQHHAFVVGVDDGMSWWDRPVLDRHFSQFGRVIEGKSVAFVSFETNNQLERALDVPHVVSGCTLRVLRAETVPALRCKP